MTAELRSAVSAARSELKALETQRDSELSKAKEHLTKLEKERDAKKTVHYWKPGVITRIALGFLSYLVLGTVASEIHQVSVVFTRIAVAVALGLSIAIAVRGPTVINRRRERVVAEQLAAMTRAIAQAQAEFTRGAEAIRRKWEPAIRSAESKLQPLESELRALDRAQAQARAEAERAAAKVARAERSRIMQSKSRDRLKAELMLKQDELRQLKADKRSMEEEHERNREENPAYWVRGKGAEPGYGPNFDYMYHRMDVVEHEIAEILEELDRR